MKDIIFYFAFDFDEGCQEVHAFKVLHTPLLYRALGVADFAELNERLYDAITEDLESRFGVHDVSSSPSPEVDGIGYTSYEVSRADVPVLMDAWRQWFSNHCALVSQIYTLPESVLSGTDADIYLALNQQIAAECGF